MCTPDLKGTQGSFLYYTTDSARAEGAQTGGEVKSFLVENDRYVGAIEGPPLPDGGYATLRFTLAVSGREAILQINDHTVELKENVFSDWVVLSFRLGRKTVSGLCRVCLRSTSPHVGLYISPVNVDPEKPALPIARPILFASWLSRRLGRFGTLGLMEDTWGRNENALDDQRFLDQTYLVHAERERMFFEALDRTREGLCACVFDASDRIQHMFWRYLDERHPSPRENGSSDFASAIPGMYERMDQLIGRIRTKLQTDDLLLVLSDHGFASFRRGINLNTWLKEQGYLVLKEGKTGEADYLRDVDWEKSRAFALGLTGLYVNLKGRESRGIVSDADAKSLKKEIARKLEELRDPETGERTINRVYDASEEYRGLYTSEAPDLIVGYYPGYRVSWDSVTGIMEPHVFSNNVKAWSGDHHVDPELIPGIFFSSERIKTDRPHIRDLAPTVLEAFGVPVPAYMEGSPVL
ncbi:alkaline phosphatase family protein [Tautonia sociabilis]|uniref:Phosphodiesterase n=1 Tax=Tautonia sociabilis TaxID=2080755 RepID=A0A432MCZ2_9BACT|nr:alkaline phosphatase family protein [Tautonia sociabilis]RUL82527.1 phosphodiesterase [Tautonia sociabilis]